MKPNKGLIIDVIAEPTDDDEEVAPPAPGAPKAPAAPASSASSEALLDSIQTQLDQLRMQLMR